MAIDLEKESKDLGKYIDYVKAQVNYTEEELKEDLLKRGLSDDEVSKYILHKIQLAGASSTIIDSAALAAVHSFAQGNPRLIDNLMTDALTIGSQQDKKVIDAETIRAAVDNQGLY